MVVVVARSRALTFPQMHCAAGQFGSCFRLTYGCLVVLGPDSTIESSGIVIDRPDSEHRSSIFSRQYLRESNFHFDVSRTVPLC